MIQLVEDHGYPPEYLTTAWFCRKFGRWYDLITSRKRCLALSKTKPEKYQQAMDEIDEFYGIVHRMKFLCPVRKGGKIISFSVESKKPYKWGTLLTITSIKQLVIFLLVVVCFIFVLCGKFGTEAVENLFSSVRRKKVAPTPLEFKYILRALMVMKWMKPPKGSSYEAADETEERHCWIAELKEIRKIEQERKKADRLEDYPILTGDYLLKDYSEENAMCLAIGYMLGKTIDVQGKSSCNKCQKVLVDPEQKMAVHNLIQRREYTPGAMTYPTKLAHDFYSYCESVWHKNHYAVRKGGPGLQKVMDHLLEEGEARGIPVCHLELTVNRWFKIRMYFEARQLTNIWKREQARKKQESKSKHASASMAAHALKHQ